MIYQNFSHWMRAPGGRAITIGALAPPEEKDVIDQRSARFDTLLQAYQLALAQGMTHKIWIASGDRQTRPHHGAADGQVQRIDDRFTVGADSLFLPSDPGGSLAETANCRCTVRYVRLDSTGLPDGPLPPALPAISPPATPRPVVSPGSRFQIDLRDHEGGLHRGHALQHVGQSHAQMMRWMAPIRVPIGTRYKAAHSTFSSHKAANALVSATLATHRDRITEHLAAGLSDSLVLGLQFGAPTGTVYHRKLSFSGRAVGRVRAAKAYGVRVVIKRNRAMPNGFGIVTAFPMIDTKGDL